MRGENLNNLLERVEVIRVVFVGEPGEPPSDDSI